MAKKLVKNSSGNLIDYVKSEEYADFYLYINDECFPIHRVILASKSKYFDGLFSDTSYNGAKNSMCLEEDVKPEIFEDLLNFIYSEVVLTPENVHPLREAAVQFEIDKLVKEIDLYLSENPSISKP